MNQLHLLLAAQSLSAGLAHQLGYQQVRIPIQLDNLLQFSEIRFPKAHKSPGAVGIYKIMQYVLFQNPFPFLSVTILTEEERSAAGPVGPLSWK